MTPLRAAFEQVEAHLLALTALKQRTDIMPVMTEWQWVNSLRNSMQSALGQAAQPEAAGWKLVPIEPTQEMLDAAETAENMKKVNGILATHFARSPINAPLWTRGNSPLEQAWAAMLAATPEAQNVAAQEPEHDSP